MSDERREASNRAAELRRQFDRAFAEPAAAREGPGESLLAMSLGEDRFALPIGDVVQLLANRRIVPLPSPVPALLGLCGFRGRVVAVYGLRPLFGVAPGPPPRWIALVGASDPVGLAFDQLDGQLSARPEDVAAVGPRTASCRHIRAFVRSAAGRRAIVDVGSVLEEIRARASAAGSRVEE